MVGIKDLLAVLDKWPAWKRIQESPERIDEMEARIAMLEQTRQIEKTDTGNLLVCEYCASSNLTMVSTQKDRHNANKRNPVYKCNECDKLSLIP